MDEGSGGAGSPAEKKGGLPLGKIVAGCLIVLLLVCVAGGFFGLKLVKWGRAVHASQQEILAVEGSEVAGLLAQAKEAAPFDEPESPTTTAERLEVFLGTREQVHPSGATVLAAWDAIERYPDLGMFEIWEKAVPTFDQWAETRKEFAAALVSGGMSEGEYTYLHRLVFHSGIVEGAILEGKGNVIELEGLEDVPEETKVTVLRFEERIQAKPSGKVDRFILGLGVEGFVAAAGQ